MAVFQNRIEAGRVLAERLAGFAHRTDVIVLALPRGGVPVAFPVAEALNAPLDVFIVRKLGAPGHEELAMGAIATGGVRVLNQEVIDGLGVPDHVVDSVTTAEATELARREREYRDDRPPPQVREKTVILIDDGLATGSSMHAAVRALREQGPAHIVVAVPAAPRETCDAFKSEVDEVICAITPGHFLGVGQWYQDFSQTTDAEVRELLKRAQARHLTQVVGS